MFDFHSFFRSSLQTSTLQSAQRKDNFPLEPAATAILDINASCCVSPFNLQHSAHKLWSFLSPLGFFFTGNFLVNLLPCSEILATWVWQAALKREWLYFSGPRSICDRNKHHHEHVALQVLCLPIFLWYHSSFKMSNNISGALQLQSRETTSENKTWDRFFKDDFPPPFSFFQTKRSNTLSNQKMSSASAPFSGEGMEDKSVLSRWQILKCVRDLWNT